MPWMRVEMTPEEAAGQTEPLQEAFASALNAVAARGKKPDGAAMYETRPVSDENAFYFNPEAAAIFSGTLKRRGATECAPPDLSELTPLARIDW